MCFVFFFNDTATTEIYTLSLHDALPICGGDDGVVDGMADGDSDGGVQIRDGADGDITGDGDRRAHV